MKFGFSVSILLSFESKNTEQTCIQRKKEKESRAEEKLIVCRIFSYSTRVSMAKDHEVDASFRFFFW